MSGADSCNGSAGRSGPGAAANDSMATTSDAAAANRTQVLRDIASILSLRAGWPAWRAYVHEHCREELHEALRVAFVALSARGPKCKQVVCEVQPDGMSFRKVRAQRHGAAGVRLLDHRTGELLVQSTGRCATELAQVIESSLPGANPAAARTLEDLCAKAAVNGYTLSAITGTDGKTFYLVSLWPMLGSFGSLEAAAEFLSILGVSA